MDLAISHDFVKPPGEERDKRKAFDTQLQKINDDQQDALDRINRQNKVLVDLTKEVSAAQKYSPDLSLPGSRWQPADIYKFRNCLAHVVSRITGSGVTYEPIGSPRPDVVQLCEVLTSADAQSVRALPLEALPSADVSGDGYCG